MIEMQILAHNVPRFIKHIKERGGVSDEEMCWLQCADDTPDYPEGLLARADEYLLYPKDEEAFEKGLFVLVLTLAIMSFTPGGIEFLGIHFSVDKQDYFTIMSDVPPTRVWGAEDSVQGGSTGEVSPVDTPPQHSTSIDAYIFNLMCRKHGCSKA